MPTASHCAAANPPGRGLSTWTASCRSLREGPHTGLCALNSCITPEHSALSGLPCPLQEADIVIKEF